MIQAIIDVVVVAGFMLAAIGLMAALYFFGDRLVTIAILYGAAAWITRQ